MAHVKQVLYKYRNLILRLLIGALLLWFLFRSNASLKQTFDQMVRVSPIWLFCAFLAKFASESFTAFKWHYLMRKAGVVVRFVRVLYVFMTGLFYGLFLPGIVGGDVVRVVMLAKESGGKSKSLASTFMQRNTGVAGLLLVADIALLFFRIELDLFKGSLAIFNDVRVWFLLLTVAYLLINLVLLTRFTVEMLLRLIRNRGAFLTRLATRIANMHRALLMFRNSIVVSVAMSVGTQMLEGLFCWFLAHALGIDIGFWWCCVLMAVTTLVALIPISFNGLGLREVVYVAMLMPYHYDKSSAIALGLLQFGIIVLVGLVCGIWHGLRLVRD